MQTIDVLAPSGTEASRLVTFARRKRLTDGPILAPASSEAIPLAVLYFI